MSSPAIGPNGLVYFGSYDYRVYALNVTTGELKWAFNTGNLVYASPAIGMDGTVYIGSGDHHFYALDGFTGVMRWTFTATNEFHSSPAIGADGTVYVGCADHRLYALNGSTGQHIWNFTTGDVIYAPVSIGYDGTVYASSYDGNAYALNGTTGVELWRFATGVYILAGATIDSNGTVFIASEDRHLYALDATTGAYKWSAPTNGIIFYQPVIPSNGMVIVGDTGKLYAFRTSTSVPSLSPSASASVSISPSFSLARTPTPSSSFVPLNAGLQQDAPWPMRGGNQLHTHSSPYRYQGIATPSPSVLWSFPGSASISSNPCVTADDLIIFGTEAGDVLALHAGTGRLVWTYRTDGPVFSSAAIDVHGIVYIGSNDAHLHAINGSTGEGLWEFKTGDIVMSSPVISADGLVIFGSYDTNVYAVGNDGGLVWTYSTAGPIASSPAIGSNGVVYIGTTSSAMYGLNVRSGSLKWVTFSVGSIQSSPAIGPDNTVYISYGSTLCAMDGITGSRKWLVVGPGTAVGSPALSPFGLVLLSFGGNRTSAVNMTTGTILWNHTASADVRHTGTVTADGLFLFATEDRALFAVNTTTGTRKWTMAFGDDGPISTSISIGRDGAMFAGSVSGHMFALSPFLSSPSPSPSGTPSCAPTHSPTLLPTTSISTSFSMYASISASPSPTLAPSPSATALPSYSASPSVSPSPLTMSIDLNVGAFSSVLSDSMLPVPLHMKAHYCRESCVVRCDSSDPNIAVVVPDMVALPAWSGDNTIAALSTITAHASFGLAANVTSEVFIQCTLGDKRAQLAFTPQASRWPLIKDAMTALGNGLVKPAWGAAVNLSSFSDGSLESKLRTLTGMHATAEQNRFHVLTSPDASIVLVAEDSERLPPFSNLTLIHANDIPCEIGWVADSGLMIQFTMPSESLLCTSSRPGTDCGYVQLFISTHSDEKGLGTTLSCPPFCPNDFPDTIPVPVHTAANVTTFLPGRKGGGVLTPLSFSTLPSTGFYITAACSAAGYLDPALGICTNASDPRAALCGFGAGVSCRACPTGSICPGGYRAWPLPGYYAAIESSGAVIPCAAPSQSRCLGWNASMSSAQCGVPYMQGSYKCEACAAGYYAALDGTCITCPFNGSPSAADILQPIAIFVAGLLAACAFVYLAVLALSKVKGTVIESLPKRVLQLGVWTFTTVQVVSQVGQAASPGLPPLVLAMYSQLSLFQFRGAALPSGCLSQFPFVNEVVAMSIALTFMCVAICAAWYLVKLQTKNETTSKAATPLIKRSSPIAILFRLCIIGISVPYATVSNTVFELLGCSDHVISKSAYDSLVGTPTQPTTTFTRGDTSVTVSLLVSNPTVVCYTGAHTAVAALAWFTLFVYCIGLPTTIIAVVSRRIKRSVGRLDPTPLGGRASIRRVSVKQSPSQQDVHTPTKPASPSTKASPKPVNPSSSRRFACLNNAVDKNLTILADVLLTPFIAGDYRPSRFWFFAFDRTYFLVLAAAQALLSSDADVARFCVTITALLVLATLLVLLRPFAAPWKFVVKVYSLLLCILAACLNLLTSQQALNDAIEPLGMIVVVASVGLFVALGVAFFLDVLNAMPERLQSKLPTEAEAARDAMRRSSSVRVSVYVNPLLKQESLRGPVRVALAPVTQVGENANVVNASPRESMVSQRMRLHRASNVAMAPTSSSTRKPQSVRKLPNASARLQRT